MTEAGARGWRKVVVRVLVLVASRYPRQARV